MAGAAAEEVPIPPPKDITHKRPGTSGTELGLRVNRQKAQTSYQRAQRAEQAYRARRQATTARSDVQAAKEHFRVMTVSLKAGLECGWHAIKLGPAVWSEKQELRREKKDIKKKEAAELKKKMLEEKLKKAAEADAEVDPAEEPVAA